VLPRFFIDRPIFAAVISVLITLAGALAVGTLPVSQYPPVTPPTIQIDCNYPGASSKVVSDTVAAPIEQRVNGVERMMYMASQCTSDGSYTCTVTFEVGTDLNMAQVLVQNRVNLALAELPDVVRGTGVTTRKRSPEILLTIALQSPDGRYDQLYLSNYAVLRLKDELQRIRGISDVTIFGQRDYSLRVWVDPEKLAVRGLTSLDVVNAIRGQNQRVSVGELGGPTGATRIPLTVEGRLSDPEQFGRIVVKAAGDGGLVRVRDVARVELAARSEDVANRFDGKQTVGLAVFLLSDANALETAAAVKAKMAELSRDFPDGVAYEIGYDTTPFIGESIREVFQSLGHSVILVAVVVLVFLQSWRSALIPLATVPVAIIGTFAAMWAVGFGVNNLTLFGLVLAVGIVVDDAIVVVEAVQQQLEKGYQPREATLRAMEEVAGPVIAVGAVLVAVFLPCAFLTGIVGSFFRQFALTIAISAVISTFNSLTLSPALAALLLKPATRTPMKRRFAPLSFAGRWFDRTFDCASGAYVRIVGVAIRVPLLVLVGYGGILGFTYWGYLRLPTGFIPSQDKGFLIASVQLPDAASAERTREVVQHVSRIALETPGVKHVNAVAGNSFVLSAYGSNFGSMFIILDDFEARKGHPDLGAERVTAKLRARVAAEVPGAQVNIFGAPPVPGLGRSGGIKLMVEDRGELGPRFLQGQAENMIERGNAQKAHLSGLFTAFRTTAPQLYVDVDPAACAAEGVRVTDVYATMQATLGSRYVNDFNRFGRTWQVNVQADARFRRTPSDIRRLKIKSIHSTLVPLGTVAAVREVTGPPVLTRYNMYPAASIQGNVAAGASSGEAIAILNRLADQELPANMSAEWTDLTFLEVRASNTGVYVFAVAVLVVFLVLAALYESWGLPLAVILVVPMCVSCSLVGVWAANADVNIFTQIGFVVLIGLASKNSILIVEYAKVKREEGASRRDAVLAACRLRLRPIVMTSLAFVLGVLPLVFATGAGAEMRTALGTPVFAGMLGVTAFGIFLTPVFFVTVDWVTETWVFRHPWVRAVGQALRWVFALGWVRPTIRLATKLAPPRRA
jgi:multidrug efflux pump